MSGSPLMSLGIRAMNANFAALQTVGNNIANANVAGYSRQQVQLSTAPGQFTGSGYFGRGVNVDTVSRSYDALLAREAMGAKSLSAMDSARLSQLNRLELIFKPGESGLGHAVNQFLNSMVDVSSRPGDGSARQVVLARAGEMSARFNAAGAAINELQAGVSSGIRAAVAETNALTQGIAQANQRIAAVQGLGQPANDLLDERDRLIARLSEKFQISQIPAADGTVGVFSSGGQRLVLGAQASKLVVAQDETNPGRVAVGIQDGPNLRLLQDNSLGSGEVAGLLRFQNRDLVDGANLIGRLAAGVGAAVNSQQQRGLSLKPQGDAGAPLMFGLGAGFGAAGPQQAIPNAKNVRGPGATGAPLGSVSFTISDPAVLQASDYQIEVTAGVVTLRRLPDGAISPVADGDVVDGVKISFGAIGPQEGDRFLLRPVARAAVDMTRLMDDPRDLAAASPLIATMAATNTGTGRVGALSATAVPLPFAGQTETITFNRLVPAQDGFNYTTTSSLGGAAVPWNAGTPVVGANGFVIQIDGVPGEGDVLTVKPTPASAISTNNGNVNAMLTLRDAALVDGQTVTDAYALAMSEVGVRVQSGRTAADLSSAVADQARAVLGAATGVNLDEEAARLIQFQQTYQAAAKMLQVAQTLFDVLLQTTAR